MLPDVQQARNELKSKVRTSQITTKQFKIEQDLVYFRLHAQVKTHNQLHVLYHFGIIFSIIKTQPQHNYFVIRKLFSANLVRILTDGQT